MYLVFFAVLHFHYEICVKLRPVQFAFVIDRTSEYADLSKNIHGSTNLTKNLTRIGGFA